jgi:hypothetical protein
MQRPLPLLVLLIFVIALIIWLR